MFFYYALEIKLKMKIFFFFFCGDVKKKKNFFCLTTILLPTKDATTYKVTIATHHNGLLS